MKKQFTLKGFFFRKEGWVTALVLTTFFFFGCYEFFTIQQPTAAYSNETFEVPIVVKSDQDPSNDWSVTPSLNYGIFGVLVPDGWEVSDSIMFTIASTDSALNTSGSGLWVREDKDHDSQGYFVHSNAYSDSLTVKQGIPPGYHWWGSISSEKIDLAFFDSCAFVVKVKTDSKVGTFFLQYTLGDEDYAGRRPVHVVSDVLQIDITNRPEPTPMDAANLIKDGHFDMDGPIATPWATWSGNGGIAAVEGGVCVMTPGAASDQWQLQVNQTGNDNGWRTGNDSTFILFFDAWADADRVFAIDFEDNSGNGYKRYGLSSDPDAVNGECEWQVNLTTTKTTYTRVTTFNAVKENTTFKLNIMPSAKIEKVYIDNIYLIYAGDLKTIGTAVTEIAVTGAGGATAISADKGTLQMSAAILPSDASAKNIAWSVTDGTGSASINASGVLTASTNGTVTVKATSAVWTEVSGSLEVTISGQTVGVSSNKVKNVNVYPNPVVNELNVTLSSPDAKVAIYNGVGRKLTEVTVQGTQARFDVSGFDRGVYFIKVNNDSVVKFVK